MYKLAFNLNFFHLGNTPLHLAVMLGHKGKLRPILNIYQFS